LGPFGHALLGEFRLDPAIVYLNHGGFGVAPKRVLEAQRRWSDQMESEPGRYFMAERPAALEAALTRVAGFLRTTPESIAFTHNATHAANAVLWSLGLGPDDEIVVLDHGYGAVNEAARVHAERGGAKVVVVRLPYPLDADGVVAAFAAALTDRTRLAVVDHITSPTGLVLPLAALIAAAHDAGVPIFVDGAHAPGQLDLDLGAIGADWYTGNLHKWAFAPKGTAFLYASEDSREGLGTPIVSHPTANWRDAMHWTGTNDTCNWLAAPAGLDFIADLGADAMRRYQRDLADRAATLLADAWGTSRAFPREMHAAMVTVVAPGSTPPVWDETQKLWTALRARGVEVAVFPFGGRVLVRIAAQIYNEISDYERLAAAFLDL